MSDNYPNQDIDDEENEKSQLISQRSHFFEDQDSYLKD